MEFCELDIAGLYFQLGHETHTSADVFNELCTTHQSSIGHFCRPPLLVIHAISPTDRMDIYAKGYPNTITSMDKTGIYIAAKVGGTILTSERIIVNYATKNNIACEHFGWVFDQLTGAGLLTPSLAADKLSRLVQKAGQHQAKTSFLPELENRINTWRR